ncbi:putative ribonuclease H-like domain-containing protein [Tanacetum coccineum]
MSPPIRRKYHDSVAFATGCKKIKKCRRGNRKIRIPIAMWPCRVEEKMTLKEVDGQAVEEIETKIIAKDGTITRVPGKFQGYETSEEEPVEQPRRHDLYGFVDHPQLQQGNLMNEFAPHWLPQSKDNMNGWLLEDEDEVDSDLESTASIIHHPQPPQAQQKRNDCMTATISKHKGTKGPSRRQKASPTLGCINKTSKWSLALLSAGWSKKGGAQFSWVFFLRTKDETSGILKDFIRQIKNQLNQKVKTIRCDNGTEFKNRDIIEFCGSKGIKREYSNARTPQQNRVAKRKNKTLIEAARTMLADSFLPNTFWAEAVSTACYVLNRVLVIKPQNKTPYELITGPEEANHSVGTQDNINAGNSEMEGDPAEDYFVLPICSSYTSTVKSSEAKNEGEKPNKDTDLTTNEEPVDQEYQSFLEELERLKRQEKEANDAAEALRKDTSSSSGRPSYLDLTNYADQDDSQIPTLEDIYGNSNDGIFTNASYDDEGAVADFTNLKSTVNVSPIPTLRIHSIHPISYVYTGNLREFKIQGTGYSLKDEK